MNNIVPAVNRPDGSDADASHAEQHARGRSESRRRRTTGVPTREECLRKLAQLPGLVAMKIISPAESNAISRSLQVILAEMRTSQSTGTSHVMNEQTLQVLRDHPDLQELLEPLLSDDQIDQLMRDVTDDAEPET